MRPGRGTFILEKIRGKRNDIYASQSIKEFTESLSQAILQQIPEQKSIGKRFLDLLKGFHPILSYDALTGQPEISFEFTEQKGGHFPVSGNPRSKNIDRYRRVSTNSQLPGNQYGSIITLLYPATEECTVYFQRQQQAYDERTVQQCQTPVLLQYANDAASRHSQ